MNWEDDEEGSEVDSVGSSILRGEKEKYREDGGGKGKENLVDV